MQARYTSPVLVVLIVADSVRADAPGFGGGPDETPLLDRLAAEGTTFDQCYSSAAWTVPSMVALTTGTFPHRVGVARWRHPFPRRRPTLMSAFAAAGFEVRTVVHNPRFCLANTGVRGTVGDSEVPTDVIEALSAPVGTDRFVLIHHWWTHLPYVCSKMTRKLWKRSCDIEIEALGQDPEDAVPRLTQAYHDTLAWFDSELLGRYLDAAAASGPDVLVGFTADHGETWGASLPKGERIGHMYDLHGRWITDETTRVPLLLWGRGTNGPVQAGRRVPGFARGVDVAPTLCDLAGVPWPGPVPLHDSATLIERGIGARGEGLELDGVSLGGALRGGATPVHEVLTVTSHNAIEPARYPRSGKRMWSRYGLRTASRRYVWDGLFGLRDLVDLDRAEDAGRVSRLRDRLVSVPRVWSQLADERAIALGPGEKLDRELFPRFGTLPEADDDDGGLGEQLRLLGYTDD